ncbi:MAG: malonyl-ACP O-methyltransferase BioC [Chlorobiaceae bacterium]|nr:malonyl-ACP O-methyltransferase BioC [Chlorobiaceae bacterium]
MSGLVDKQLVGHRFRRALPSYSRNAGVQRYMAGRLLGMIERAGGLPERIGRAMEFGCGAAMLTSRLFERYPVEEFFANDLVAESRQFVEQAVAGRQPGSLAFLPGDIEQLDPLPGGLDLVLSNATVQWLHDPARLFERLAQAVRPGGVVAFSTFGTENMREIAALGETPLGYRSIGEIAAFAGTAFEPVEIEHELRRQEFDSPEAVLRHIRATGVNGVARRAWTRSQLREFLQRYRASFPSDRGVWLTWHPVWCCFRRRHP